MNTSYSKEKELLPEFPTLFSDSGKSYLLFTYDDLNKKFEDITERSNEEDFYTFKLEKKDEKC